MKYTLLRLAIYIPIITAFYWIFTPHAFDAIPFEGSFITQLPGYIVYYVLIYGFWIAIYEAAYHTTKRLWKPAKETKQ